MGLPQILIKFKTAGSTAIRRSARGQVVLLVPGGSRSTVTFSRMDQVEESAVGSTAMSCCGCVFWEIRQRCIWPIIW